MLVTEETVLKALEDLAKPGIEFHSVELAQKLTEELGANIQTDVARYWANQMCLKGVLERKKISKKLYVYHLRSGKDLPASMTIQKQTEIQEI